MRVADFAFDLPEELIARYPLPERRASRLLHLDGKTGAVSHGKFIDILNLVNGGDLLIFNNTRVIPARMFGKKASGGKLEVLVERLLDDHRCLAHVRASKSPTVDSQLILGEDKLGDGNGIAMTMVARHDSLFELKLNNSELSFLKVLDKIGHIPLPPYIDRPDEENDQERYQTVYNQVAGAVAAPTAGLHFDEELLQQLRDKGVNFAFVTLHVGAGTFQPVRVENVADHKMHSEFAEVSAKVVEAILATKAQGKRVIAVGTTSVRSVESAGLYAEKIGASEIVTPFCAHTDIFIYPSKKFRIIDAMITNFHLPESTLIMLVCAFAGTANTLNAYGEAVRERYRFFSYGDAMFVEKA